MARAVKKAIDRREPLQVEYRILRLDGSIRTLQVEAGIISDRAAGPKMIGITQDITERKQREEAQSRLAAIVESAEDAIISTGSNRKIMSWNSGAEDLFGYAAEEAIGQPISLIHPKGEGKVIRSIDQRLEKGERVVFLDTVRVAKMVNGLTFPSGALQSKTTRVKS